MAILRNPRYTGFEVWNKQRRDEVLIDVEDVALGHETRLRWNKREQWIFSANPSHEALVSQGVFDQAQAQLSAPSTRSPHRQARSNARFYPLRGLIVCAACNRRMEGSWNNERVDYRCTLKTADTVTL